MYVQYRLYKINKNILDIFIVEIIQKYYKIHFVGTYI